MRRHDTRWYVVRVISRAEERARVFLSEAGFGVYLPMRRVERQHRRTKAWRCASEVLIPGYLFIEFPEIGDREWYERGKLPSWRAVMTCPAVLNPLGQVGTGGVLVPIPVPTSVVEALMASQASMAFDDTREAAKHRREERRGAIEDLAARYPVGSEVIARYGPFAGVPASVVGVSPKNMVDALLDLFGRMTPVSFPIEQLEGVAA